MIQRVFKQGLGFFVDKAYPRLQDKVRERVENRGWRRETTEDLREALLDSIDPWYEEEPGKNKKRDNNPDKLRKLIDVFLWVYDSDDAYALMFHRFIDNVRENEELDGYAPFTDERFLKNVDERGWKEEMNMEGRGNEAEEEALDEFKTVYSDLTKEVLEEDGK